MDRDTGPMRLLDSRYPRGQGTVMIEKACVILRQHGIAAYEQAGTLVIFVVSTAGKWEEVMRIDGANLTPQEPQLIAIDVAGRLMRAVSLAPHTHDLI